MCKITYKKDKSNNNNSFLPFPSPWKMRLFVACNEHALLSHCSSFSKENKTWDAWATRIIKVMFVLFGGYVQVCNWSISVSLRCWRLAWLSYMISSLMEAQMGNRPSYAWWCTISVKEVLHMNILHKRVSGRWNENTHVVSLVATTRKQLEKAVQPDKPTIHVHWSRNEMPKHRLVRQLFQPVESNP